MGAAKAMMIDLQTACALIGKHEGFRATRYRDTRGFWTIGYGTNLDAHGSWDRCKAVGLDWNALRCGTAITQEKALLLMQEAVQSAIDVAVIVVKDILEMPANVQLVVVDMIYNLGAAKFAEFKEMLAAIERRDWPAAAAAMKDSDWYSQVKTRGDDDIALMLAA